MLPLLSLIFKKFKSLIVLFFIISNVQIHAQIVYIPDSGFKNRLLHHTVFGGEIIDTNGDHEIQVSEAEAITMLDVGAFWVHTDKINNLTGIEAFVNITSLDISHNYLTDFNIKNNTLLTQVWCNNNQLTNINVSPNTSLEDLFCQFNDLTLLDISNNPQLMRLNCSQNLITALDIFHNIQLEYLNCSHNQIPELNVTNNTQLIELGCNSNQLPSLDVTQNPLLEILNCSSNLLPTLDTTHNLVLFWLNCKVNQLSHLDVGQNTVLVSLICSYNQLNTLNVTQNPTLNTLWCSNNHLIEFDVRNGNNTSIESFHFNATNNSNLSCVLVDDAEYSRTNWLEIDTNTTFVETQAACDSLGIDEGISSQDILAYPNPTYDILNIDISNSKDNTFIIYDMYGRVSKQGLLNKKQIDIEALDVGVYLLSINGVIIRLLKL